LFFFFISFFYLFRYENGIVFKLMTVRDGVVIHAPPSRQAFELRNKVREKKKIVYVGWSEVGWVGREEGGEGRER
jgi:hypothetical protein